MHSVPTSSSSRKAVIEALGEHGIRGVVEQDCGLRPVGAVNDKGWQSLARPGDKRGHTSLSFRPDNGVFKDFSSGDSYCLEEAMVRHGNYTSREAALDELRRRAGGPRGVLPPVADTHTTDSPPPAPGLPAPGAHKSYAKWPDPPEMWEKKARIYRGFKHPPWLFGTTGITDATADEFGVGRTERRNCVDGDWYPEPVVTVPGYDGDGNVIGIHTRSEGGGKRWEKGSTPGLFGTRPALSASGLEGTLYVPEGFTDTARLTQAGFLAVGRSTAYSWRDAEELVRFLRRNPGLRRVVVLAENDQKEDGRWPGKKGAEDFAYELMRRLNTAAEIEARLVPNGAKDARAWLDAHPGEVAEFAERLTPCDPREDIDWQAIQDYMAKVTSPKPEPKFVPPGPPVDQFDPEAPKWVPRCCPRAIVQGFGDREAALDDRRVRIVYAKLRCGCYECACCGWREREEEYDRFHSVVSNSPEGTSFYFNTLPGDKGTKEFHAVTTALRRAGGHYKTYTSYAQGTWQPATSTLIVSSVPTGLPGERALSRQRATLAFGVTVLNTPEPPVGKRVFSGDKGDDGWGPRKEEKVKDFLETVPADGSAPMLVDPNTYKTLDGRRVLPAGSGKRLEWRTEDFESVRRVGRYARLGRNCEDDLGEIERRADELDCHTCRHPGWPRAKIDPPNVVESLEVVLPGPCEEPAGSWPTPAEAWRRLHELVAALDGTGGVLVEEDDAEEDEPALVTYGSMHGDAWADEVAEADELYEWARGKREADLALAV
jgi:hypothetical protein